MIILRELPLKVVPFFSGSRLYVNDMLTKSNHLITCRLEVFKEEQNLLRKRALRQHVN